MEKLMCYGCKTTFEVEAEIDTPEMEKAINAHMNICSMSHVQDDDDFNAEWIDILL